MSKERRTYLPRIVGDKVMMPADLKRLHKYTISSTSTTSRMKCGRWSKSYGPSWRTSCRRRSRTANHCLEAQGSAYRSGRSPDWLKMKNPDAPAVTREAEEDWAR